LERSFPEFLSGDYLKSSAANTGPMLSSVVIVTKDRRDELRAAIFSAIAQSVQPEVLVIDDGSRDGTPEMVRAEFPAVRLEDSVESLGYIAQRNRAAHLASGAILFSLDDDAEFSTPKVVEQTLRDLEDPRIGAVAVPYLEPKKAHRLMQSPPDSSGTWITDTFIGTAHALRRDIFLALGGYRETLFHQGEEADFAVRMLQAGYVTRLGRADPIYHHESLRRSSGRMDFYGRRNDILFAWQNVPMPYLPLHLAATVFRGSAYAVRSARHPMKMFAGMLSGFAECIRGDMKRRPVDPRIYRLSRDLKKHGPLPLRSVIDRLPPLSVN
jgi:GT2 family glycosyltransferase